MSLRQNNAAALRERRGLKSLPANRRRSQTTAALIISFVIGAFLAASAAALAQETWQAALSRMPLGANVTELDRTNCVSLMLNAFQSNAVVKALIFMPGATDELDFFRRAHARLTNASPSLLDAVIALTNQTYIRAAFHPPLLLLHTSEDVSSNTAIVKDKSTAAKLRRRVIPGRFVFVDAGWDKVRAMVAGHLSVGLRPFSNAPNSWHFYRHNFAACGVTQWEMLESIALTDKTRFTVHWLTADFRLDRRSGPVPDVKGIRAP